MSGAMGFDVSTSARHVVVIAFAGGVRTRETLGTPANIPNLMRLSQAGTVYPRARTENLGHYGATLSLFTGIAEARGIRDNTRGTDPTMFEYVRKELGWSQGDVWVSTSGGAQEANLAHSLHPEYGANYGANTLDGEGLFNAEFKRILESMGHLREWSSEELSLLDKMRCSIGGNVAGASEEARAAARMERLVLDQLDSGTKDITGLGSSDAKALRVARNLLSALRPKLLTVVLRDADAAHRNYSDYVQIIRRNDAMLGELWRAIQDDPELAKSTAVFVLPEFGRDADLNARRGLDHGDGSDDLRYVAIACWGGRIRRGQTVNEEVRTTDLCTTVCGLFGAEARYSRGRMLPRLLE